MPSQFNLHKANKYNQLSLEVWPIATLGAGEIVNPTQPIGA